jgi:hypothetical protein
MVWGNYISGGEKPPRVDLVTAGVVKQSIELDDIALAAIIPSVDYWARLRDERFVQDAELRKRIDGIKQPIKGGFYYQTTVDCPMLDKTYAGYVNAIINHCALAGNNYAHFYPHLDVTAVYFVAWINGQVERYKKGDRVYPFWHTAELQVFGLEPIEQVPWIESHLIQVLDIGIAYPAGELLHTQVSDIGIAYPAAEIASDIGQVLKDNKVYNLTS